MQFKLNKKPIRKFILVRKRFVNQKQNTIIRIKKKVKNNYRKQNKDWRNVNETLKLPKKIIKQRKK